MREIIRLQFVELIHKYDIYQAKKRAEGLVATRKMLTERFIKLYRAFRHKKYGEEDPFGEVQINYPKHIQEYSKQIDN